MTKRYNHKLSPVEAILCRKDNLDAVARFSGGEVIEANRSESILSYFGFGKFDKVVSVPTVDGMLIVDPGQWLVKDLATGRWFTCDQEFFRDNYESDWGLNRSSNIISPEDKYQNIQNIIKSLKHFSDETEVAPDGFTYRCDIKERGTIWVQIGFSSAVNGFEDLL